MHKAPKSPGHHFSMEVIGFHIRDRGLGSLVNDTEHTFPYLQCQGELHLASTALKEEGLPHAVLQYNLNPLRFIQLQL